MPPEAKTDAEKMITQSDAAAMKADMELLRKDIKQLFTDVKTVTKSEAAMARKKTEELRDDAVETAREKREDVESYVRENPLGALAAAAGVGFVLALLVGR